MAGHAAMDLVLLADDEGNSVRITVHGQLPSVSGGLAAEIVVETPFVTGRLALSLWRSRLEAWERALDHLEAGQNVSWMEVERGPSIFIQLTGGRDCPEVIVEDDMVSMVTVRVPVDLPPGWIATHRERLHALMAAWGPAV